MLRESLRARGRAVGGARSPCVPSPEQGWRTRVRSTSSSGTAGLRLGLHEEGIHRVVDLEALPPDLARAPGGRAGPPRRPRRASRTWRAASRDVELAESVDGQTRVAASAGDGARRRAATGLASLATRARAHRARPRRWRRRRRRASSGSARRALRSRTRPRACATASHVLSFFQANRFLVEPLVEARARLDAARWAACSTSTRGVGLFALRAGRRRARGAPRSSRTRARAADARGQREPRGPRERADRSAATWREVLAALPARPGERIVLDPPRTGAGAAVVRQIAARRPAGRRVRLLRPADARPRPRGLRRAGLRAGPAGRVRPVPRHVPPGDGRPPDAAPHVVTVHETGR